MSKTEPCDFVTDVLPSLTDPLPSSPGSAVTTSPPTASPAGARKPPRDEALAAAVDKGDSRHGQFITDIGQQHCLGIVSNLLTVIKKMCGILSGSGEDIHFVAEPVFYPNLSRNVRSNDAKITNR